MFSDKCVICGSEENLQDHHLSHNPEITIPVCVNCHKKIHRHGVGLSEEPPITRKEKREKTYAKRWSPITFTITGKLLKRLDGYINRRKTVLGGTKNRSSVVEDALIEHLFKLERELSVLEGKDLSVVQ